MALVNSLHTSVREAFVWPQERFRLASRPEHLPEGARPGLDGYIDADGFHFAFAVDLPTGASIDIPLTIESVAAGDRYTVKAGSETFTMVLHEGEPSKVISYVRGRIREAVKASTSGA